MNDTDSKLYMGSDGNLYEILFFDSDTAILRSLSGSYVTAAKPYFDETANIIDFSSGRQFQTLTEAEKYAESLKKLFADIAKQPKITKREKQSKSKRIQCKKKL